MKKLMLVVCSLAALNSPVMAEEDNSNVAEAAKKAVSGLVTFGKDLIGGASEGVVDGRKEGKSKDAAIVVSNQQEFEEHLSAKVLAVKPATKKDDKGIEQPIAGSSYVEVGFKNNNSQPVRMINLKEMEAVIAMDKEGYATVLSSSYFAPDDLTIPSNAGKKHKFYFKTDADGISQIRILNKVLKAQ